MATNDERIIWQQSSARTTATIVMETALFALVMILALVGNLMVCCAFYRNPRLRHPSNYYIVSLAVSDILQATVSMPLSIGVLVTGGWPFSRAACSFMAISKLSLAKISVYTMTIMAVNRYVKIVQPAKYPTAFQKRNIVFSAVMIWFVFISISAVGAFVSNYDTKAHPGYTVCFTDYDIKVAPVYIIVMHIPYVILFFCYYKIYSVVKCHRSNVSWQSANVEDINISKVLFVTVVGFVILWLPAHVTYAVSLLKGMFAIPRLQSLIAVLFVYGSSCVNPFIYGFMNRAFRKEFKKLLTLDWGHLVNADVN